MCVLRHSHVAMRRAPPADGSMGAGTKTFSKRISGPGLEARKAAVMLALAVSRPCCRGGGKPGGKLSRLKSLTQRQRGRVARGERSVLECNSIQFSWVVNLAHAEAKHIRGLPPRPFISPPALCVMHLTSVPIPTQ